MAMNPSGPRRRRRRSPQDRRVFERLVVEAMDGLPARFRRRLSNVAVVVEDEATEEHLSAAGLPPGDELLGLYQGTPLTDRTSFYGMVLPDKITIFRGPLERMCTSRQQIRQQVRETIVHEFAHHFGLSDEDLDALGL